MNDLANVSLLSLSMVMTGGGFMALFYILCPYDPGDLLELAHGFSEMSHPEAEDPQRDDRVWLPGMLDE